MNWEKLTITKKRKKLWRVFAKWIKKRDKNRCFTCNKYAEGKGIHAGHFIPKSIGGLGLYFEETNIHAQCYNCNINLGGNGAIYYVKMVEKYGQEHVDSLMKRKDCKITKDLDWETLYQKYAKDI